MPRFCHAYRSLLRHLGRFLPGGRPLAVLFPALMVLSACSAASYQGQGDIGIEDPITRRLMFFDYLNGEDIRAQCGRQTPDRARMVLNGRYRDQVRTYELGDGTLRSSVYGMWTLDGVSLGDLLSPLEGVHDTRALSQADAATLWRRLQASGAFEPAPDDLVLRGDRLFWIAVGCREGRVFFNAWQHPSPRFDALAFPAVLAVFDGTGVPWPQREDPVTELKSPRERAETGFDFRLGVAPGGLRR